MRRHSIRWRLPLSYAAIAFLAALALGLVLITVLVEHYSRQERQNLRRNARTVSRIVSTIWSDDLDPEQLSGELGILAFLTQTQIKLLDMDNQVLVDSGKADEPFLSVTYSMAPPPTGTITLNSGWVLDRSANTLSIDRRWEIAEQAELADIVAASGMAPGLYQDFTAVPAGQVPITVDIGPPVGEGFVAHPSTYWPVSRSPFGLVIGTNFDAHNEQKRSDETVTETLSDSSGNRVGTVQVSGGPAIGSEILDNVTRAWLYAGGFAVLIAAVVGWFISRQISTPLVALTQTTTTMAAGDLSVRTSIDRRDELGILASTFNTMAGRIEDTVTTLQRFAADAAHELHTPLTALRTDLELIGEAQENANTERALSQIGRLQSLADDLLDLSRIESDYRHEPHSYVNLRHLVENTSALYASRAEQADIVFDLDLADPVQDILGNEVQLERLLGNLLDNAVKFTSSGGSITVRLHEDAEQLVLAVEDTGIGILGEDIPYLFGRFHRGRNTAAHPGSGLGLAIAKAIVDSHHATITTEQVSSGAKFVVRFPIL